MTVKVGILGAGHMGRTHGRILRGDARVKLCAVFDVDPQRKLEAARELECAPAETEESRFGQLEAVYITVPNTMHAAAVTRALHRGKHIFCEKPFAVSLEEARVLRERCLASSAIIQVGHNRRFAPVYMLAKDFLASGRHEATLAVSWSRPHGWRIRP